MCCRSEWQENMYIYKWHEVDQTKHEIFCVHIVCNEIQVKVNLEITTFFFYLRFPYCPNFFWFGVVTSNHCFWLKYESFIHNIAFSSEKVISSESGEKYAQIKHYCDVCISCLDSIWWHPFTAEKVSKWCNATFLQIWRRNKLKIWWRNKLIYILDGLRVLRVNLHQMVIFGWTVPLTC